MALAQSYEPERTTIEHKDSPLISVRGLNFTDLSVLVSAHQPAMDAILAGYRAEGVQLSALTYGNMALKLLLTKPDMARDIILRAGDLTPEDAAQVDRFSASLQAKIILEVARMTFEDIGGPLELAALVLGILGVKIDLKKLLENRMRGSLASIEAAGSA